MLPNLITEDTSMNQTLPHPDAIFALRRRQAAALRAGVTADDPQINKPFEGKAENDKAVTLAAADKQGDRPKLPSPLFLTGGSINFY